MKTIAALALLTLAAQAFAQEKTLSDAKLPEAQSAAPAEAKPAAEITVIQPGKAKAPAAAAKPAQQAPAAAPATAKKAAAPRKKPAQPLQAAPGKLPPGFVVRHDSPRVLPKESPQAGFKVRKRHTVVKGDTLWDLSGQYYKNPFMWGRIYNANYASVADPDLINPNEELLIPDIDEIVLPYRRPVAAAPAPAEDGGEEAETVLPGDDGLQPWERARAARARAAKTGKPAPGEILSDFDQDFISEEMPEDQREWGNGVRIVGDDWREDGVITAKARSDDEFLEEGFSMDGAVLEISMNEDDAVRPGDYLAVYLKGGEAYDKAGAFLGREIQPAGLAEVLSVDGSEVKARVIDATTAIFKGYIVKKK